MQEGLERELEAKRQLLRSRQRLLKRLTLKFQEIPASAEARVARS